MRTPVLVGFADAGSWREVLEQLRTPDDEVEPWLVLFGARATQAAVRRIAEASELFESRVVLAGRERAPDPEADPAHLAGYLAGGFVSMTKGRPVQLLADPARPRTFAVLAELASVLNGFSLRLPGHGLVSRYIPADRRRADLLPPSRPSGEAMLGQCEAIERVRADINRYARLPWPVLVLGETGTGKELVARALHDASEREGRYVTVNAARLIDDRAAESELFGHVEGAFTGATKSRKGRFREAVKGTLFLDEIPNLSPGMQARLLRALNHADRGELRVYPMGADETAEKPYTVRFVAAAQRDPREDPKLAGTHAMRDDLYWRIATLVITLPPLRDRGDDVLLLARHFLDELTDLAGGPLELDDEAERFLRAHEWPGNVRELQTVLRRAWVLLDRGELVISREHLEHTVTRTPYRLPVPCDLQSELGRLGRQAVEDALDQTDGNKTKAAALLGITRDLSRKLEKFSKWEESHDDA